MRRLWLIPLVTVGLLLLLAAALWLFRLALTEQVLLSWLELKGLQGSTEVERLDLGRAELRNLDVEGLQARRVEVHYALPALFGSGRIERVEAEGLRLAIDLTSDQPFGRLGESFAGQAEEESEGTGFALPVLPVIDLQDAELALITPRGPVRLALNGGLLAEEAEGPARRLDLELRTLEGPLALAGRVSGRYRPSEPTASDLTLALASDAGPPVSLDAVARLEGNAAAPDLRFSLDLQGDLPLLAELAALPVPQRPTAGRTGLQARGLASLEALTSGHAGALLIEPDTLHELALDLQVQELALPGYGSGIALNTAAAHSGEGSERQLRLEPSRASARKLDPTWLQSLGLPPALAAGLASGAELSVTAPGDTPLALHLAGPTPRASLDLLAVLSPSGGGQLEAEATGQLELDQGSGRAALVGALAGRLRAETLSVPDLGSLEAGETGFELDLAPGRSSLALLSPATLGGLVPAAAALAQLPEAWGPSLEGPLDLALGTAAPGSVLFEAGGLAITLPDRLRLATPEGSLDAELEGTLALTPEGSLQNIALRRLQAKAAALPTPYGLLRSLALSGRLDGRPLAATGGAEVELELEDLAVEGAAGADISARLALDADWQEEALALKLREPGELALEGFAEPLQAIERIRLDLQAASLVLEEAQSRMTAEAALAPTALDLDGRGRKDELGVSARRLAIDLTLPAEGGPEGSAEIAGLEANHREVGVTLRDAALEATFGGDGQRLELTRGHLASAAEPPLFPALDTSGSAELTDGRGRFRMRGRGLAGALVANLQGSYDLDAGRGTAELAVEPVTFAASGPQPGDLNAGLAALEQASGTLSARASLRFGDGFSGTGTLGLQDIGFTAAGATVRGLDLELALDSLSPATSPPDQPFSIERIDFGTALSDVAGTVEIVRSGGATALRLGRTEASFLGGRLALDSTFFDPSASRHDLTLLVERVDLERLLALADLEEVSGNGQLSGSIPLSLVEGVVVVRDGRLAALSPGVIAFRSEEARQALASGGEAVDLMLQALEDFHYQVLELSLDKPAEGDSRVLLKLEGSNPAVLDGQPFVLNINLTSNAAPLLAALAQGTEISSRLVEELLEQRAR